jgi:hypothetical protein
MPGSKEDTEVRVNVLVSMYNIAGSHPLCEMQGRPCALVLALGIIGFVVSVIGDNMIRIYKNNNWVGMRKELTFTMAERRL